MTLELDVKQRVGFLFTFNQNLTSDQCKSTSSVMGSFIRTLEDNILTMLSINIFRMFLENVILSFISFINIIYFIQYFTS